MFYDKNGRNFSALTFTVDTVVAKGLGSRTEKMSMGRRPKVTATQ